MYILNITLKTLKVITVRYDLDRGHCLEVLEDLFQVLALTFTLTLVYIIDLFKVFSKCAPSISGTPNTTQL